MRKKKFDKQILEKAKRVIYYKVRKREMRFSLNTSLLALVFAIGAADVLAAPTVRSLGTGSISTSASAPTSAPNGVTGGTTGGAVSVATGSSSRAGSLRTGGYIGPRATVSTSSSGAADSATQSESTGTAVSSGSAGLNRASSSRLSVGSYIGAPHHAISTDGVDIDLSGYVEKFQGKDVKGEALIVGNDGYVTTGEIVTPDQLEIDLSHKVDKDQRGSEGKVLIVNESGFVEASGDKVDREQRGSEGKALVVNEHGFVEATGEFLTSDQLGVDLSTKVDKNQSGAEGNVLSIDPTTGYVTNTKEVYFKEETDEKLAKKLNNTVDAEDLDDYGGKALVVNPETGVISPSGDFVNRAQPGKEGKVLMVGDNGYVTTGSIDVDSLVDNLDLGALAYKDQIKNEDVADDAAIERKKMAEDITDTLDWVDTWKNQAEDPETGDYKLDQNSRYVMAIDEFGEKAWFRVVVE